jgi:hypothetical protein
MYDRIMKTHSIILLAVLSAPFASWSRAATVEELATKTGATENKAPGWIKHGALVYRLATPDDPNTLTPLEEGIGITCHLLDETIQQIPLAMGLVGHDHLGSFNWDGMWPYWNRVTFRAGTWQRLHDFMQRVADKYNTRVSFHVNLTDVNVGLRDYPETQAFFQKLVETRSIYRRDYNPQTKKRDAEPPYVPEKIPAHQTDPIQIFALVNYRNFWTSGMARQMIDEFYGHLPYPPPILYVDVLNLAGGNFSTGFPNGPLGGSKETQLEGVLAITDYLRSKGTDIASEGIREMLGPRATYVWLHGKGISRDDYSVIDGGASGARTILQHVLGNSGCFVVSPIASTTPQLEKIRQHYAQLLAAAPSPRTMPGLETLHLAERGGASDEFNIAGPGGDPLRGDWIDLVNGFYLSGIQELYHIGKGNVRTAVYNPIGVLHVSKFTLTDADGKQSTIAAADCLPPSFPVWAIPSVKASGHMMLEGHLAARFHAPRAGKYRLTLYGNIPGRAHGALNVYVNRELVRQVLDISFHSLQDFLQPLDLGEINLPDGESELAFDAGPIYAQWSDGTAALWKTPFLGKGFQVTNGDVTFADDYDRMWPDTWSGQKKIYFFSWDGTSRAWKLPPDWATVAAATLYPLGPDGRSRGLAMPIAGGTRIAPKLLPQIPYVLVASAP